MAPSSTQISRVGMAATCAGSRRALLHRLAGGLAVAGVLPPAWAAAGCRKPGKPCDQRRQCCSGRCAGGKCARCRGGKVACGGACVDPETDRRHCGRCGRTCPDDAPCLAGFCVSVIGRRGNGNGEFDAPRDVAVDAAGTIYVADTQNNRIQLFDANGAFLAKWESLGGQGRFSFPTAVAVSRTIGGRRFVYVADRNNQRIAQFTDAGEFVRAWGGFGSLNGQFQHPSGVALDTAGNVYVADTLNHRIQKFDDAGVFLTTWGGFGSGHGAFDEPFGVAVGEDGTVYVADVRNFRIQAFSSTGVFRTAWGGRGRGDSQFGVGGLFGLAIAQDGTVYVGDSDNDRVQRFTGEGVFLDAWGAEGSELGELQLPTGVAIAGDGTVFVADSANYRIQRFDPT